jgi:hypothetical protein
MAYNPQNANGQATMANSAPVVIASNQSAVSVSGPLTDTQLRTTPVPVSGTFYQATQPVSIATLPSLAAGSNAIGSITNTAFGISGTLPAYAAIPTFKIDQTTPGTTNKVNIGTDGTVAATQSGTWNIGTLTSITNAVTVSQGTATSLKTQAESYQGGSAVSSSNPLYVTVTSSISGGDSTFHLVSAATTNATNIKASAGKVTGWYIYNSNASARKVAFHNTAGTPTAGASIHSAIVIPGLAAANVSFPDGIDFSTGIAITTVQELTDGGATGVALNDLIINIYYK